MENNEKDILETGNLKAEIIEEQEIITDTTEVWGDLFSAESSAGNTSESSTGNNTGNSPESSTGNNTGTNTETVNDDDVGVDLLGAMTMLNLGVGFVVPIIANFFDKEIDGSKILATDAQLKKLAKAGKPLYEKYLQNKMSAETAFIICLVSVYGGKILSEIKDKPKKTSKKEVEKKEEAEQNSESWLGDSRYFQTGIKKGTLKPKK